jgi:hypothetical protein
LKRLLSVGLVLFATAASAQVVEVAQIKVTGGSHAGSYTSSSAKGGCSVGFTTPGAWGNQLSTPKDRDPNHFNSLQIIVPNPKKPAEFYLMAGFGSILNRSAEYKVETRVGQKKSGSGTVNITDKGATGKIDFTATTSDGIKLSGQVDCKEVKRLN